MSVHDVDRGSALGELVRFRQEFYECLPARTDALFELSEAELCTDGPVRSLVGLSLTPEQRRGHGALYDAVNCGQIDVARLRKTLAVCVAACCGWTAGVGGGCPRGCGRTGRPARSARSAALTGGAPTSTG